MHKITIDTCQPGRRGRTVAYTRDNLYENIGYDTEEIEEKASIMYSDVEIWEDICRVRLEIRTLKSWLRTTHQEMEEKYGQMCASFLPITKAEIRKYLKERG